MIFPPPLKGYRQWARENIEGAAEAQDAAALKANRQGAEEFKPRHGLLLRFCLLVIALGLAALAISGLE